MLRTLELVDYRSLRKHRPGFLAERLGIGKAEEERCLAALAAARQIKLERDHWVIDRSRTIDTRAQPARARKLKAEWLKVAQERLASGVDGVFSYNVMAISRRDLERLREMHVAYFRSMQPWSPTRPLASTSSCSIRSFLRSTSVPRAASAVLNWSTTCPGLESAVSGATVSAILALFDFIRHIDKHLLEMTQTMGPSLYAVLFVIVFAETGLVVTPFLPGDSLLFAIGVLCAMDPVRLGLPVDNFVPSLPVCMGLLFVAAVLGDGVNYHIGKFVGPKVFSSESSRLLNKKHLIKTQLFYEKYGPKTIIIARFVPIVRTFAPFVAGIGQMQYRRFIGYNIIGAALWVGLLVPLGYAFADTEVVKKHFELVIMAIIILSILPMIIEIVREKMKPAPAAEG